jgi:nicotinamide-nucleotide amidase
MRCEVVAVGTELLLGQIVDTNSSWIGEQLALSGIDSYFQTKVGDNLPRIVAALRHALERSDAVIVCGGLGPTHDDITRDAIAEVMGVPLKLDADVAARITAMFQSRGRAMPESNLRQAMVPVGATAIRDPQPGTAPGLLCPIGEARKVLYAVPGVPSEMREIVSKAVLPDLRRRSGESAVILSRTLRTWGESESGLAERLTDRIAALDETRAATIAFLASGAEGLKVRLTVKAAGEAEARERLDDEATAVRALLGDLVFSDDDEPMEAVIGRMLVARSETIAVAESLTGGLLASRMVNVEGSSDWFLGGVVAYDPDVKFSVLGVRRGPVVTAECAAELAEGVARLLHAEVAVATTGVAGPEELEGQPPGTVFLGVYLDGKTDAVGIRLPGGRDTVRQLSCISALDLLRRRMLASSGSGS